MIKLGFSSASPLPPQAPSTCPEQSGALAPQLDNVLLATDAEGQACVKVCDFGYSKSQMDCTTRCGTPEYMAPEASFALVHCDRH